MTFLKNNIICAKATNVSQYVVYNYGSYGQKGESMKKGASHAKVKKNSNDSILHMAIF